jgi:hypothetical protein
MPRSERLAIEFVAAVMAVAVGGAFFVFASFYGESDAQLPGWFIPAWIAAPAAVGFVAGLVTKNIPWLAALLAVAGAVLILGRIGGGLRLGIYAGGLLLGGGLLAWPLQFRPPYRD